MGILDRVFGDHTDPRLDIRRRTQTVSQFHHRVQGCSDVDTFLDPGRLSDLLYRAAYTDSQDPDAVDLRNQLMASRRRKEYDEVVHDVMIRFMPDFFDQFPAVPAPMPFVR